MTTRRDLLRQDGHFRILRLLHANPEMSQRDLARAVGVSNGGIHYVLSAMLDKGLIKLGNFTAAEDKRRYASREVVDLLNLEYDFMPRDSVAAIAGGGQAGLKRWLKEKVYARMPGGLRAFAYFFFRYVVRLGFLDGREGLAFHVLQGLWYRFLVDAKLQEVRQYMRGQAVDAPTAIRDVLGIDVSPLQDDRREHATGVT